MRVLGVLTYSSKYRVYVASLRKKEQDLSFSWKIFHDFSFCLLEKKKRESLYWLRGVGLHNSVCNSKITAVTLHKNLVISTDMEFMKTP